MTPRSTRAFLIAAILAAASLALPLWGFRMSAPQYPDEALHLRITRAAVTGDLHEIGTLQKYIGVSLPTNIPELRWLTPLIAALALLLGAAAFAGRGRFGRFLRVASVSLFLLFLAGAAATLQKRLYDVGHHRNPHAPITSIHDFTPPVVGPIHVGNFTVWSYPHAGAALLAFAALIALAGLRSSFQNAGWRTLAS